MDENPDTCPRCGSGEVSAFSTDTAVCANCGAKFDREVDLDDEAYPGEGY